MRIKAYNFGLLAAMFLILPGLVQAQDFGSEPGKAKEQYALFTDNVKSENFKDAVEPLEWLLDKAPKLNEGLYINALKVYGALEKDKENAEEDKKKYQKRIIEIYKQRIANQFFKDSANIYNRFGYKAYPYMDKKEDLQELFDIYSTIYRLKGNDMNYAQVSYFFDILRRRFKKEELTKDELLAYYDKTSELIAVNIAKNDKYKAKWENTDDKVLKMLQGVIKFDCKFISENYIPKFEANKSDAALAKKTLGFMLSAKCYDDPKFYEIAEVVFNNTPDCGLGKLVADNHYKNGRKDEAVKVYQQLADEVCTDADDKAKYTLMLAQIKANGDRAGSRTMALKVVELAAAVEDEEKKKGLISDAYSHIGDLYMATAPGCKGNNPVESTAPYIAAYNMYAKAGNSGGMSRAKSHFATTEEIFTFNMKEGQMMDVQCWIGGQVKLVKK